MYYTSSYTDPQLFDPQVFDRDMLNSASPVSVFKQALRHGNEVLATRSRNHRNSHDSVPQRSWMVDQIILKAWNACNWNDPDSLSLLAVGGYGRQELHPASDIDIMIMYALELDSPTRECIENFLTFLWDIGLEVGHSVRSLTECRKVAARDLTVITNLMESRLLCGSRALFQAMNDALSPARMWDSKAFFEAKLAEQEQRHRKYHDTAYNLEPNIKDGPGGLRDIQMISWVAQRHFGANNLRALVNQGFLTEDEYDTLNRAQEFLWRLRCMLHSIARRKEDRLAFDYQRPIADSLGYQDEEGRLGVEQFMRQFYLKAMDISHLNEILLQLFQEAIFHQGPQGIQPLNKRFQIRNDYIEVTDERVFQKYPFALLEIFLLIEQYPSIKGIRASTGRLLRHYRYLVDEAFIQDFRTRALFMEILRQPRGQTRAMRFMNRYGILGAYIPAFGQIVGQMQYDLFHVYTVDQHTLFVIRNLRRFYLSQFNHEFPLCSRLMQNVAKPELLYLAALFHDIAKGRGGDHSELGQHDAINFCQAHNLSDNDSRFVAWLVRNHLLMSTTAQRQDISDPEVIKHFAYQAMDAEHLDYLYLLTVADIRGTNPSLWNSWKSSLLAELYHNTRSILQESEDEPLNKRDKVEAVQTAALRLLDTGRSAEIQTLWSHIDESYFLRSSPEDVAGETEAILNSEEHDIVVLFRKNEEDSSEFIIYAKDKEFLFAETTHYLEQQGLTIMDAYLATTNKGYTLLSYTVLQEDGEPVSDPVQCEYIRRGLQEAASRREPLACPINRRPSRQIKHFQVATQVSFSRDLSNDHTVMEVVTTDHPGVLSRIAQAMMGCGIKVKKAKIATLGSRVEDIFFIVGQDNSALHLPDQFDCLQEKLVALLDNPFGKPGKK